MSGRGHGRGAYYKQKYGRGGKKNDHHGASRQYSGSHEQQTKRKRTGLLGDSTNLAAWLRGHESRPYPAYHDIEGCWSFESFEFFLDHAQADPYASPSKAHIRIPHSSTMYPESLYQSSIRKCALADYLLRVLYTSCTEKKFNQRLANSGWSGGKGGQLEVDRPGQQVLERSAVVVRDDAIEIRLVVGLPARGRSIMGEYAAEILCQHIPSLVESIYHCNLDAERLESHVLMIEDQDALRSMLPEHGLVGFVCEGAILARKSGASDGPMPSPPAVPFQSPASLKVELDLPNRGKIRGMGIRKQSVYVCLGGGFHGKSTFLAALSSGSYNHIPGDGREFVSVVDSAVSVRSEDGRAVHSVDISPFINNLPDKSDTRYAFITYPSDFSTSNASGSTSCAAGLMEALEVDSRLIILDEDSSASNFLVRDKTMAELVPDEPITPLVARARDLVQHTGATVMLVCGSSSAFLSEADVVVQMDHYRLKDITAKAKEHVSNVQPVGFHDKEFAKPRAERMVKIRSLEPDGKVSTRGVSQIQYGRDLLDLHAIPQLVSMSQTRAIEAIMKQWSQAIHLPSDQADNLCSLQELVEGLDERLDREGIDALQGHARFDGFLARPRRVDLAAAGMYSNFNGSQSVTPSSGQEIFIEVI